MDIILSKADLRELLAQSSEIGAKMALIAVGQLKPYLSKTEAYNQYGRCTVDRWVAETKSGMRVLMMIAQLKIRLMQTLNNK